MIDILRFTITGAAAGAILALLGLGVNVIFRASRVINFSHAAIALTAAYAYKEFLAILPTPLALLLALVVGIAIGALVDLLVMRPLRAASALTKAMATIGVLLTLQSILNIRYGHNPIIVPSLLPTSLVQIAGIPVGLDRLLILVTGIVMTAVLWAVYRFTSFGIASTALSVNERTLAALGKWEPRRVSLLNWVIAGGLAALAGVLLAPITSLSPTLSLMLIVPILSAALLGNLNAFWLTLLGGVLIGIAQAQISRFATIPGLTEAVPFLVIVILLAVRGSSLPQRGESADTLPQIGSGRIPWWPVGIATGITLILVIWVLPEAWVAAVTTGLVAAIVLLSLVVVTGYAGQLSLASFGLAGVAALVSAQLVASLGWSFLPAAIVGVLATAPVGVLVGLPAVRTRGTALAVVTLGLAVALQALVFDNGAITNGISGLNVGNPTIFGLDISAIFFPRRYAVFTIIVFVLTALAVLNLRRSAVGRRLVAVRGNERAAASIGISVPRTKLYAFVVSGMIAGIGGVLIAFTNLVVALGNPGGRFDPSYSITAIAQSTVGGVGYVGGAIAGTAMEPGAVVHQVMSFITQGSWFNLIGGLLLLVTVVTAPSGIAANLQRDFSRIWRRIRRFERPASPIDLGEVAADRVEPATLRVRRLNVAFGGNRVLHDVDVDVKAGEVLGVIGPNGAGKTTLVDAITGYNRPESCEILLDDRELKTLTPAARARAGVGRSFQALELFEDLSVLDNLLVASERNRWYETAIAGILPGRPRLTAAARAAVKTFGLEPRLRDAPGDLSYGERRLLAIARALASRPRVLLLDEPAAGLGSEERGELRQLVRSLAKDWGIAVLIIEHDVELVMGVSDTIVAMDFGRIIARGTPQEVRNDPAVIAAYLGANDDDSADTKDGAELVQEGRSA
ncbi:branched-chain amino acid ABC transporter permease/ATP-binding protein [Microbacterium rhizophilus]|uniref:branched-chain amino acid ABC transporter permease/ATP-binding protein n=1 Tax=Microbacterium rhizophilus TaxID=3138934 RepID=UPI0031ECCB49